MYKIVLPRPLATILLPITEWLPNYPRECLLSDIISGCTVFVLLIPQGMAYSLLAGMPAIYGLYTSIIPLYIYAIFGTSRQLSLGPMATTSLLLSESTIQFNDQEMSDDYISVLMKISLMVGIITLLMGIFRFGAIANMISGSVLVGFLTASALVICLNQLKHIFGITVPPFQYTFQTLIYILQHLHETNPVSFSIGLTNYCILYLVRRWRQKNKPTAEDMKRLSFRVVLILSKMSNIISLIFGSFIAYIVISNNGTLKIIGTVPSGLKAPVLPTISFGEMQRYFTSSVAISLVAFTGNWAVAQKYAFLNNYKVDATQELIAEGLSVTIGVFFNSFAGSGGLARTAVAAESGAQTQLVGCIVATLMLISVQYLTRCFFYIPMAILGSIILISVMSMIDFHTMIKSYAIHRQDCIVMVVTFISTFFIGVSVGLYIGVIISIGMIVFETSFPTIAHLGKLPESEGGQFRDVRRFPSAEQIPGIAIVRMDATLFFANCEHFKDVIMQAVEGHYHTSPLRIEKIVIDAKCWIDIDLAGISKLFEIKQELVDKRGLILAICSANGKVRDKLQCSGFVNEVRTTYHNYSVVEAVSYATIPSVEECVIENRTEHASSFIFSYNPLTSGTVDERLHHYTDMHSGIYHPTDACSNPIHSTELFPTSPMRSTASEVALSIHASKDDPSSLQTVVWSLSSKNHLGNDPVGSSINVDSHRSDRGDIIKDDFIDDDCTF